MKTNRTFVVATLAISRHFGGHEEGGWWYDWTDVQVEHSGLTKRQARRKARALERELSRYKPRYNRFSVLGGTDHEVIRGPAQRVMEHQSTRRPRYE